MHAYKLCGPVEHLQGLAPAVTCIALPLEATCFKGRNLVVFWGQKQVCVRSEQLGDHQRAKD